MNAKRRLRYSAQVLEVRTPSWGCIRHLRVWRNDGRGGIPWDDLQDIKDEMLGAETCAIEFYPPAGLLVNEAHIRHLWEVPDAGMIPFGLHPTQRQ
jgi:hypothetical protein